MKYVHGHVDCVHGLWSTTSIRRRSLNLKSTTRILCNKGVWLDLIMAVEPRTDS
jgi:hypothetical protein